MKIEYKITALIAFLTKAESIWSLFLLIYNSFNTPKTKNKMETEYYNLITSTNYWVFNTISLIIILIITYIVVKLIYKQLFQLEINNLVNRRLNMILFMKFYNGEQFEILPNESIEDFHKRLPKSEYMNLLKTEYDNVFNIVVKKYNKKPSEIKNILDNAFFIKNTKS